MYSAYGLHPYVWVPVWTCLHVELYVRTTFCAVVIIIIIVIITVVVVVVVIIIIVVVVMINESVIVVGILQQASRISILTYVGFLMIKIWNSTDV